MSAKRKRLPQKILFEPWRSRSYCSAVKWTLIAPQKVFLKCALASPHIQKIYIASDQATPSLALNLLFHVLWNRCIPIWLEVSFTKEPHYSDAFADQVEQKQTITSQCWSSKYRWVQRGSHIQCRAQRTQRTCITLTQDALVITFYVERKMLWSHMDHKFNKRIHGYHSLKQMKVDRKFKTKKVQRYQILRTSSGTFTHQWWSVFTTNPNPEI